jgi:HEPN domain-containing protein
VYTPQEIRFLFSVGSPFIEEVIERGRLLYMRKATQVWLQDAEEELDMAMILLEHGKNRGACYHAQQSSEKSLKSLIIEKGKKPGRIQDIVDLLNEVVSLGYIVSLSMDNAIFLNSIYRGRYPTEEGLLPHGEPSYDDAQRAIKASKELLKSVKTLLGQ